MIPFRPIGRTSLILLALLSTVRAGLDDPVTPQQADTLFAWFDKLPIPGLHGSDLVRVWSGQGSPSSPVTWLASLIEENEKDFTVLEPGMGTLTYHKHGTAPGEGRYIGFRRISLLEEAREFASQLATLSDTSGARRHFLGVGFSNFDHDAEDLTIARWCATQGDEALAVSILDAIRKRMRERLPQRRPESLEASLQESIGTILTEKTLQSFAAKKPLRQDLLESFRQITAFCPKAKLPQAKEAIVILERMLREDALHPPLSDEQLTALLPAARATELVFRLRDERRRAGLGSGWPSNGSARALEDLGLAAAPALVQALDEDSFTREPVPSFHPNDVSRVRDMALDVLCLIAGSDFKPSGNEKTDEPKTRPDIARAWWKGVSQKGEKDYLMERIVAADSHYTHYALQLLKKYPEAAVPFIVDRARKEPDTTRRIPLSIVLWKQNDPRCVDFFAGQLLDGRELGDRLVAAYGLRLLHDIRAVPAMGKEWQRIVSAQKFPKWTLTVEDDEPFTQPWGVAVFLSTSNAPDAILRLGEQASSIPVEWRANLVRSLIEYAGAKSDELFDSPSASTKIAIEDVLHGFLTDTAIFPIDSDSSGGIIADGRICDLAARGLHSLLPEKHPFDDWLSPIARNRQCILSYNARAQESGELTLPVPPEPPKQQLEAGSERKITEVETDAPFDQSESGIRLSRLRGSLLEGDAIREALLPYFSKPEGGGFVLTITRYRDQPSISIHLQSRAGQAIRPGAKCEVFIVHRIDRDGASPSFATRENLEVWTNPKKWDHLLGALTDVAKAPPNTPFVVMLVFGPAEHPL